MLKKHIRIETLKQKRPLKEAICLSFIKNIIDLFFKSTILIAKRRNKTYLLLPFHLHFYRKNG